MNSLRISFVFMVLVVGVVAPGNAMNTPSAYSCPVTVPNGERPSKSMDPFANDESVHFENGIWVTIPDDGVLQLTPDQTITFGPLTGWRSQTVTWLRDSDVEGWIVVSGERLDTESDLSPQTPLSPQRQYARTGYVQTGIAFPADGCWKVIGTVGDRSIAWVVNVRFVDKVEATPMG